MITVGEELKLSLTRREILLIINALSKFAIVNESNRDEVTRLITKLVETIRE